jgi:hypothetical protein
MSRLETLSTQLSPCDLPSAPKLLPSRIRYLDIGNNYFQHINPRKKKTFITLLDAYIGNILLEKLEVFEQALKIYFQKDGNGPNEKDWGEQIG